MSTQLLFLFLWVPSSLLAASRCCCFGLRHSLQTTNHQNENRSSRRPIALRSSSIRSSSSASEPSFAAEPSTTGLRKDRRKLYYMQRQQQQQANFQSSSELQSSAPFNDAVNNYDRTISHQQQKQQQRKQYARKLPLSPTEKAASIARQKRRLVYERMRSQSLEITNAPPSIWSFDSLFAAPVVDEEQVRQDLFGIRDRDAGEVKLRQIRRTTTTTHEEEEEEETMQQRRKGIDLMDLLSGSTASGSKTNNGDRVVMAMTREEDVELTRQVIMNNIDNSNRNNNNIDSVEDGSNNIDAYVKSRNAYATNIINDEAVANVTAQSLVGDIVCDDDDDDDSSTSVNPRTPSNIITSTTTSTSISPPLTTSSTPAVIAPVDKALTRMVQDRIYGLSRTPGGTIQYSTSMLDTSRAVQFREGIRLGRALKINIDRLCHFAKKDVSHGRLEEGQEYYTKAQKLDPTDGRPYLGLSRIAQRRGDVKLARDLLKEGIHKSVNGYVVVKGPSTIAVVDGGPRSLTTKQWTERSNKTGSSSSSNNRDTQSDVNFQEEEGAILGTIPDLGPNPHLLQALGTLEQECGNLALAEDLYLQAIRSRPSHSAAWVALAQLRTNELRQNASAGRLCYRSAERELQRIGARPNAYVYTAWASMEYKRGSSRGESYGGDDGSKRTRLARELYQKALAADSRCSAAYLQLGVMESECGNYDEAELCFEEVLKFDQRNSRVLQAYAIMESRRTPREDVDSRRVLDLYERALKANPRDAGVCQAYALYVAELGDVDSARDLLQKGAEVNKRHAPVWQAWGVLESRYNSAKAARDVFQQGIWSCAQPGGGQSGGRRCARLWQGWGVLESQEGDYAAARRCFSRALDADKRNVAAVTAWTLMEAELGNISDARSIFERSLKLFRSPSVDKTAIWRAYEVMEERAGNTREAQVVFHRSMRESMSSSATEEVEMLNSRVGLEGYAGKALDRSKAMKKVKEEEISWLDGTVQLDSDVWMKDGSIEGKVPAFMMKKLKFGQKRF